MNLKEFCEYLGIGQTKAREIVNRSDNKFVVRLGNKIFIHKELLDEYLNRCAKYSLPL